MKNFIVWSKIFFRYWLPVAVVIFALACGTSTNIASPPPSKQTNQDTPQPNQPGPNQPLPSPPPPNQRITETVGAYRFEIDQSRDYPVMRFLKNSAVLSRRQFIEELADVNAFDFRSIVNRSIVSLPVPSGNKNGYMLQAPVITNASLNEPFYFVAILSRLIRPNANIRFKSQLLHCNPAPHGAVDNQQYQTRFIELAAFDPAWNLQNRILNDPNPSLPYGAAYFKGNPPGQGPHAGEIMVSPCPSDADLSAASNEHFGHIYPFAMTFRDETVLAHRQRIQSFWATVGRAALRMLNGGAIRDIDGAPQQKLFLSTHGRGIPYLHFRVENHQRYYYQVSELLDAVESATYYRRSFP